MVGQLIGTGLSLAGGLIDAQQNKKRLEQGRSDLATSEVDYNKSMSNLASQKYGVGQREKDLALAMRGRRADTSGAASDLATSLDFMDPRSATANISNLMAGAEASRVAQSEAQRQADIKSTGYLAEAEKQARDANLGLRRQEGMMESNLALQNLQTAGQNVAGLEAQNPWADALGNVANVWAGYEAPKNNTTPPPNIENGGKLDVISRILENGGKPIVQKLDGPEDHDKKKFAIMESGAVLDEDNGEKVAEATGQEYILNSEQAKTIHDEYNLATQKIKSGEEMSQDEWMSFYEAVNAVFSLPQFNEQA